MEEDTSGDAAEEEEAAEAEEEDTSGDAAEEEDTSDDAAEEEDVSDADQEEDTPDAASEEEEEEPSADGDAGEEMPEEAGNAGDTSSENTDNTGNADGTLESEAQETETGEPAKTTKLPDGTESTTGVKDDENHTIIFRTEKVTVVADQDAFNTEVTMTVKPVTDPDQLLKMITALREEGGSYTVMAYTVSFYDADGKEVEPLVPVQVTVNADVAAPAKSKVVHVGDDDKTEVLDADIDKSGASFELGSFSDIGVATEDRTRIPGSSFDIYLDDERTTEYEVGDLPAGPILAENLPEIAGYEFANATAGDVQVEEIGTITDAEGNVYVYYTTKSESGEITAAILGDGKIRINLVATEQDTSYDLEVDGVHVHIDAPAGAFEPGTYMEIQPVELSDTQREQVKEQAAGQFGEDAELRFRAVDITFYDKYGQKVQPRNPVNVTLTMPEAVEENFCVVHLGEDDSADRVEAERSEGGEISFTAGRFSIYIVVDDGTQLPESRATINFYRADPDAEPITVYVKNSDTADQLKDILYDPGIGALGADELFRGWCISTVNMEDGKDYTVDTPAQTIEDIREFFEGVTIKEGDVYNIYPMIFKAYSIQFKDEDNVTIHSDILINKTGEPVTYEINTPYTPKDQDKEFQGWNVTTGSDKIHAVDGVTQAPFPNETEVEISGNVVLTVEAPQGFWLSFQENGSGASYTPPQFIQKTGDTVTVEPPAPTRLGYTFGGWYENPECTGQPFTFGTKIDKRTSLYAKWTPVSRANYTVIIWHESMTDTYAENAGSRNYDFVKSYTFTGNVGSTINAVTQTTNDANLVTDADGSYYNLRIQGTTPNNQNVNEVYSETGYHAAGYDTGKTIAAEGTTVINVYYDRNAVTYTFHTLGSVTNWILCEEDSNSAYGGNIYTRSANGRYNRYYRTPQYGDGNVYYRQVSGCGGNSYQELVWKQSTTGAWVVYQDSKGLYGEPLNWPSDSGIWWYPKLDNNNTPTGTRMTYKDAFLPTDSEMTVDYYGRRSTGNGSVHFWTQDVEGGNHYTEQYSVSTSIPTSFSINDKFSGFYAYQYRSDNGTWQDVGALDDSGYYGEAVGYYQKLDIRYNRVKNKITFMDGGYFDGNGNELEEEKYPDAFRQSPDYYYQADVSAYNEDGSLYYIPDAYHNGYTFAGWYADDACTQPYDFKTMSASGITVYAKWVQTQYRVFLHPNVPQTDASLEWGQTNQQMNFRVTNGEKIAGGSMINGERSDYELIGWYTDPDCKKAFNFDAFVLNDTTVTQEYDKSVDMTDPMNKYGVVGSNAYNADVDRPWVTKKLDLYAKWRSKIEGARGIDVIYDANGGTKAPRDPLQYLDRAEAVAQAASTPADPSNEQFLYWVVQKWNGSEYVDTLTTVYPGDSFEVLKANAKREDNPEAAGEDDRYTYTVQLRAEYGPSDAPTPTHIWWFPNYSENGGTRHPASAADNNLKINQAVDIEPAPSRPGYKFLGWARVDHLVSESADVTPMPTGKVLNLTESDLFLKYENGEYKGLVDGQWKKVEQVAADEQDPYHDMYAVWEKQGVAIEVRKTVTGNMADVTRAFTFTAALTDGSTFEDQDPNSGITLSGDKKSATFSLKHGESVTIAGVPSQAAMTITESNADGYTTTAEGITGGTLSGRAYSFTVPNEDGSVTFTNNKTVTVDTGIRLDFLPYALLLGTVAAGAVWILRRRKEV